MAEVRSDTTWPCLKPAGIHISTGLRVFPCLSEWQMIPMWPLSAFLFCCCFPWVLCPPEPISLLQRRYSWNVRRFGRQMEMERVLFWKKHFEQIRGEPRRGRCAGFFKWTCVRGQRIAQHPVLVLQLRERMGCEQNSNEEE